MQTSYESRIIDKKIAYWHFLPDATLETFQAAFAEFNELIDNPEIDRLVVHAEMEGVWDRSIQQLWLQTGEICDQAGVLKWGVVTPDSQNDATINLLLQGGHDHPRSYEVFISGSLEEVIDWAREPLGSP